MLAFAHCSGSIILVISVDFFSPGDRRVGGGNLALALTSFLGISFEKIVG
jgi:hypothetical protein